MKAILIASFIVIIVYLCVALFRRMVEVDYQDGLPDYWYPDDKDEDV